MTFYHRRHPLYVKRPARVPKTEAAYSHDHGGRLRPHMHVYLPVYGGWPELALTFGHENLHLTAPDWNDKAYHRRLDERMKVVEPILAHLYRRLTRK